MTNLKIRNLINRTEKLGKYKTKKTFTKNFDFVNILSQMVFYNFENGTIGIEYWTKHRLVDYHNLVVYTYRQDENGILQKLIVNARDYRSKGEVYMEASKQIKKGVNNV